jgi:hypothetical protein
MVGWQFIAIAVFVILIAAVAIYLKLREDRRIDKILNVSKHPLVCPNCGYKAKSKIDPMFGVGELCADCVRAKKTEEPTDKKICDRFSPGEREKIDRAGILAFKTVCNNYLSTVDHCKYCTKNDPNSHGCTAGYRYVYTV